MACGENEAGLSGEQVDGIARRIVDESNGEFLEFGRRCIAKQCRKLRNEYSDTFVREVEDGAESYLWESLIAKVKQLFLDCVSQGKGKDDTFRFLMASAARHAIWRARRAAIPATKFSSSRGESLDTIDLPCPIEERPARGWTVVEFVGRIKTDQSKAGEKLAAQLKVCAILAASGVSTRQIGEALEVSHETARGRLKMLAEFLPGKAPPQDDSESSLAELEEQIGARYVRRTIARRKRAADESADESRRAAELRHIGAGRRKLRGTVSAAEYLSGERSILRGGFRAPGLSLAQADLIVWRDARYVARLLDGLRPIGGRVVDWQPIAARVESAPLSVLLGERPKQDRQAAQEHYDAPRFVAAAHRMAERIAARRAASAAE